MIIKVSIKIFIIVVVIINSTLADSVYHDNSDGTVIDILNDLQWQKEESSPMNWEEALTYCENLDGIGAKSDWRLPNLKELQSLVDYTRHSPAIDVEHFPGVGSSNYWSSTTSSASGQYGSAYAWRVNFYQGTWNIFVKTSDSYVRCVRNIEIVYKKIPDTGQISCYDQSGNKITCPMPGDPMAQDGSYSINPPSFTDNEDGTVTDNNTGLIWQKTDEGVDRTWGSATSYCADNIPGLPGAGWRLPTIKELVSIRDMEKRIYGRFLNNAFTYYGVGFEKLWSSDVYADDSIRVWYVDLYYGNVKNKHKDNNSRMGVQCVRDGQ